MSSDPIFRNLALIEVGKDLLETAALQVEVDLGSRSEPRRVSGIIAGQVNDAVSSELSRSDQVIDLDRDHEGNIGIVDVQPQDIAQALFQAQNQADRT